MNKHGAILLDTGSCGTRVVDCKGTTACLDRLRFLRPVDNVQDPEIEKNLLHQWPSMSRCSLHQGMPYTSWCCGRLRFLRPVKSLSLSLSLSLCRVDRLRFLRPVKSKPTWHTY